MPPPTRGDESGRSTSGRGAVTPRRMRMVRAGCDTAFLMGLISCFRTSTQDTRFLSGIQAEKEIVAALQRDELRESEVSGSFSPVRGDWRLPRAQGPVTQLTSGPRLLCATGGLPASALLESLGARADKPPVAHQMVERLHSRIGQQARKPVDREGRAPPFFLWSPRSGRLNRTHDLQSPPCGGSGRGKEGGLRLLLTTGLRPCHYPHLLSNVTAPGAYPGRGTSRKGRREASPALQRGESQTPAPHLLAFFPLAPPQPFDRLTALSNVEGAATDSMQRSLNRPLGGSQQKKKRVWRPRRVPRAEARGLYHHVPAGTRKCPQLPRCG